MTSADYHPGPAFDVLGKLRAAEAEVSRLRAVVARVEALIEEWREMAALNEASDLDLAADALSRAVGASGGGVALHVWPDAASQVDA